MSEVAKKKKYRGIFWILVQLTLFFGLMQVALMAVAGKFSLLSTALDSGVADSISGMYIYIGIAKYILAHFFLMLLCIAILHQIVICFDKLINLNEKRLMEFAIGLWFLGVLALICANQYLYPLSIFSELSAVLLSSITAVVLMWVGLGILSLLFLVMIFVRLRQFPKAGSCFIVCMGLGLFLFQYEFPKAVSKTNKPNIIIIGFDSLRRDVITPELMPHLYDTLQSMTVFENAITPIGRTFPAWVSILSGKYPSQYGVRYNLKDMKGVSRENSLAMVLESEGYETYYATDEKRFSHIDESFGFNKVIGPEVGVNDFLLGWFNDFPLSNIIINTRLGKILFPYNYINRAAMVTYKPQTFVNEVLTELDNKKNKPIFFVSHLCLVHWPYVDANNKNEKFPPSTFKHMQELYLNSVKNLDKQFYELFLGLKERKLLQNSMVILLSDHGESLRFPGDRILVEDKYIGDKLTKDSPIIKVLETNDISKSVGHGTDVLSPSQYNVLLAVSGESEKIKKIVSLTDIYDTVLSRANPGKFYENSLFNIKDESSNKIVFSESSLSPKILLDSGIKFLNLIHLGKELYEIDPSNGNLKVKNEQGKKIISQKQFAAYYKNWVYALYPNDHGMIPVLVNLETKEWTDQLDTEFAKQSPYKKMHEFIQIMK